MSVYCLLLKGCSLLECIELIVCSLIGGTISSLSDAGDDCGDGDDDYDDDGDAIMAMQ